MKFKTHPILKDLEVNEDGSVIKWLGRELDIKVYQPKGRNYTQKIVNFNSKTVTVIKLICETWNGLREDPEQVVKRRDFNPDNDHYKNLYWGARGGMRTRKRKRDGKSKIKESDVKDIIAEIEAGTPVTRLAKMYNTSTQSIYRLKWRFITNPKMVLKEAIRNARDNYYIRLAYAQFFGYKDLNEAVGALGMNTFIEKCNAVVL